MDVRLPDGTIIKNVPDGMSKADLAARLQANGYDISKLTPSAPAAPALPADLQPRQAAPSEIPGARQEPGTWQKVRNVIAPTVEMLGGAAGGVLGGAAGTVGGPLGVAAGTVGGAGLGYGLAKELLEQGDVFFGGKAPRTGAQLVTEPISNIAEGAAWEAGGQAVPAALMQVGRAIKNMPYNRATKVAKAAVMEDMPQVINALRNAPSGATVAEATAGIKNPAWQALVQESLSRDPAGARYLARINSMTEQEATNALTKLAGGQSAAQVRGTSEAAKKAAASVTTPMREAALKRGNLGQYVANEQAIREANDLAVLVGSGQKIDPARFAAQAQGAEKALTSVGIKPLKTDELIGKIQSIPKDPKLAENDLIEGAVNQVAEGIRRWTSEGGVIDLNALDAIRKNAVNTAIAKLRPGLDATAQRNAAAGVLSRIKPVIDDAIESAGGAGYKEYLKQHAAMSQKVAEKQLSGEALRLWKTDKDAFIRLVQNESPDVVEKILGPGKYDIAKNIADDAYAEMQKIATKNLAQKAASEQATEGQKALTTLLRQNALKFRLPSWMSAAGAAFNKGLSELERAIGTNSMRQLSIAMQDPKKAANLLEAIPPAERTRVLDLIADPSKFAGASGIFRKAPVEATTRMVSRGIRAPATVNALTQESENQNALSR